jgi:uncharacterized protein YggT (Ycf19 family)
VFDILHLVNRLFFGFLILSFFMTFILSFLPLNPGNPVSRFFNMIVAPVREPLDRRIPPLGVIRITFIIAMWALFFMMQLVNVALPSGW